MTTARAATRALAADVSLGFQFERLASSVLAQCICRVGAEGVFLGSRMGDSLLLQVEEQAVAAPPLGNGDDGDDDADDASRPSKRRNIEPADDAENFDEDFDDDFDDDLNIYGDDDDGYDGQHLTTYKLRIADSLTNPGPLAAFALAGIEGTVLYAPEATDLPRPNTRGFCNSDLCLVASVSRPLQRAWVSPGLCVWYRAARGRARVGPAGLCVRVRQERRTDAAAAIRASPHRHADRPAVQ